MSVRVCVLLFAVLIGLASAAKLKETTAKEGECVDNTLYAKYVCENQEDGVKLLVPGSCKEYYQCSKGVSQKKSCLKFFDPESQKCVLKSDCVEVDNTECVIPTPPPCGVTPSTLAPCECPDVPTPAPCPTCPPPPVCPAPPTCPPPTECPTPPTEPPTTTPCPSAGPGPCNSYYNPDDLYGTYACRKQKDGTVMLYPTDCNKYLYCIGGWSYLKSCASGYYFNSLIGACDLKENVYCPLDK